MNELGRGHILQGFVGHTEEFGFYCKSMGSHWSFYLGQCYFKLITVAADGRSEDDKNSQEEDQGRGLGNQKANFFSSFRELLGSFDFYTLL